MCGDELNIRVLGYADDAAMAEEETEDMTTTPPTFVGGAPGRYSAQVRTSVCMHSIHMRTVPELDLSQHSIGILV